MTVQLQFLKVLFLGFIENITQLPIDNLSITVHALPIRSFTSISIHEILPLRYMNWSTNFRDLSFNETMAPF